MRNKAVLAAMSFVFMGSVRANSPDEFKHIFFLVRDVTKDFSQLRKKLDTTKQETSSSTRVNEVLAQMQHFFKPASQCRTCNLGGKFVGNQPEQICRVIENLNRAKGKTKPELYSNILLLNGPPGTGKTEIAKAIAYKTNSIFIESSGSRVTSPLQASGAINVHSLFGKVVMAVNNEMYSSIDTMDHNTLYRKISSNAPWAMEKENEHKSTVVLFIDEVEGVTKQRGEHAHVADLQTLAAFLTELDTFLNKNPHVVIVMATNCIELVDAAIRGRGVEVKVPLPSEQECEAQLRQLLENIPHEVHDDISQFAARIHEAKLSYRDIELIISEAHGYQGEHPLTSDILTKKIGERKKSKEQEEKKKHDDEEDKEMQRKLTKLQIEAAEYEKDHREFKRNMELMQAMATLVQLKQHVAALEQQKRNQEAQEVMKWIAILEKIVLPTFVPSA